MCETYAVTTASIGVRVGSGLSFPFAWADSNCRNFSFAICKDWVPVETRFAFPDAMYWMEKTEFRTMRLATDIRNRNQLIAPAGDSKVSFIDPADIGACAAELLSRDTVDGSTFSITGPESLSFADVASQLTEVLGRTITYVSPTDDEFRVQARAENMPDIAIQLTLEGYMVEKLGCYSQVTNTVEQLLGRPATRFRDWATNQCLLSAQRKRRVFSCHPRVNAAPI
jgi:hypothetical protein